MRVTADPIATVSDCNEDERPLILIVEDDPGSRTAFSELFEEFGFDTRSASDGIEALNLVAEFPFDVIVSDVCMPRSDGYDLVRRLRELPGARDIPIILVSALAEPPRRVAGLNLGADDFIAKPVDPEELVARVRAHLRRAQRSRDLLIKSTVDELTGVLNRRGILAELRRELSRASRQATVLSLLMIDVDDFKHINDTYGHATGDEVLIAVGRHLNAAVRSHDCVGRVGGDEFIVVLPETDAVSVAALAGRLRRLSTLRVGLSVGVASIQPGDTASDLVERADRAMYRDKANHRDRPRRFSESNR